MSKSTPIVLLVLLVLAGAYVVFFEIREGSRLLRGIEKEEKKRRVFDVEPSTALLASIREFTIKREKGDDLEFTRKEGGPWQMVKPVDAPARTALVDGIVGGILFMHKSTENIVEEDRTSKGLPAYGLDEPRIVVTLKTAPGDDRKEFVLKLGGTDALKRYVYAMRSGTTDILLLDRRLVRRLSIPTYEFRETKFVNFDRKTVTRLTIRSLKTRMTLEKIEGTWMVTSPYRDRVDSLRIEAVTRAIADVQAKLFVAEGGSTSPFGLDRPCLRIGFTREDGSTDTLLVGDKATKPPGTVYAMIEGKPTVYAVKEDIVDTLTFESKFLRDRLIAFLSAGYVNELRVEGKSGKLVIKKNRRNWTITEPVSIGAERSMVEEFIRIIAGLKIIRFPNDAPDAAAFKRYGLDEENRITLTLKLADRDDRVYYVGKLDKKQKDLYFKRKNQDSIYTVDEKFIDVLTMTYLDLRKRRVSDMSRLAMRKLDITRPQGNVVVERGPDGEWRMTSPASAPADSLNVDRLLNGVNRLSALEFLTEKAEDLSKYGLDKPTRKVAIDLQIDKTDPVETKTLLIGKKMGDKGFAAKFADDDLVFTVTRTLVGSLGAEMRKRLIWDFKAEDRISTFIWTRGDNKVEARLDRGEWKLIEPESKEGDQIMATDVFHVFNSVKPERFVAYDKKDLAKYGLDKPQLSVSFTIRDIERVLYVGKARDARSWYATVNTQDVVFLLPQTKVDILLRYPLVRKEEKPEKE